MKRKMMLSDVFVFCINCQVHGKYQVYGEGHELLYDGGYIEMPFELRYGEIDYFRILEDGTIEFRMK